MATETLEVLIKVVNQATQGIQQVSKSLEKANQSQSKIAKNTSQMVKQNNLVAASFKNLRQGIVAYIAVLATGRLIEFADATQRIENRIKLALEPGQRIDDLFNKVAQSAKSSRQPLEATATAFFRIQQASKTLGITQEQALKSTELFNKLLTVQGVSMHESRSALLQFSQALQSGRFQGDEFRAISEILPSILEKIAAATGRSVTQLRELARQGKITPRVMLNALAMNAQEIEAQFLKTNVTISQGFNILSTEIFKTFRELMKNQSSAELITKIFAGLEITFKAFLKALEGAIVVINFLFDNFAIVVGLLVLRFTELIKMKVAAFFMTITASVTGTITAFKTLALTIRANPIFAIASILLTLGIAFKDFIKRLLSTKEATDEAGAGIENFNVSLSLTQTLLEAVGQQFGQWTQNLEQGATQLGETIGTQITEGIDEISAAFARSLVTAENFKESLMNILKVIGITILETLVQIGVRTIFDKIKDVLDEREKKEKEIAEQLEKQQELLKQQEETLKKIRQNRHGTFERETTMGQGSSRRRTKRRGGGVLDIDIEGITGSGGGTGAGALGLAAVGVPAPVAGVLGEKVERVAGDIVKGLSPELGKIGGKIAGLGGLLSGDITNLGGIFNSGFAGLGGLLSGGIPGSGIFGALGKGVGKVKKVFGFAEGGRPPVGLPSIVGEQGPELFVPDSAGTIVPNNAMGSTIVIQKLEILPYAQVDEALTAKPMSFWTALTQEKILPALNTLGQQGNTTTLQFRENR
jgi:tape measure domain-containing protein|tara:strand:- start:956 stop:3232 length:2277 start_codon:yes stop_codon:yes gene_type:complete